MTATRGRQTFAIIKWRDNLLPGCVSKTSCLVPPELPKSKCSYTGINIYGYVFFWRHFTRRKLLIFLWCRTFLHKRKICRNSVVWGFFPILGYILPLFENSLLMICGCSCSFVLNTLILAIPYYMEIKPFGSSLLLNL